MINQTIRARYAALSVLSQRVLPSVASVHKVATLLATRFRAPYEATEQARLQVIQQHPVPPDYDGSTGALPTVIAEARQAEVDALMALSQPVRKIPDRLRLIWDDLPKALPGDTGEINTEGLAQIIVMLGGLYVGESIDDDTTGEEEG